MRATCVFGGVAHKETAEKLMRRHHETVLRNGLRASKRVELAEPERWRQREVYTEPVYGKTRGFSSTKPFPAHRRCARAGEASLPVDRRACEGEPDTDIAYSGSTLRRDGETDETGTVTAPTVPMATKTVAQVSTAEPRIGCR